MIKNNNDTRIRKLTPLECERLQGLPDNFTKYYDDGTLVSDSERYERCGRTVTINVIEEIGRKLGYEWY
jgi:DNA (cytosine-5)-methyltransferase 1